MKTAPTREECSGADTLFVAFELGWSSWKVASTAGFGQRPRMKTILAGNLAKLEEELPRAKGRFGLPQEARVVSCYEAGREGFWLHRNLEA
jgi:transposase